MPTSRKKTIHTPVSRVTRKTPRTLIAEETPPRRPSPVAAVRPGFTPTPGRRKAPSRISPIAALAAPSVPAAVREAYGLKRAEFGRLIGYSERMLSDWESGKLKPNPEALRRYEELRQLHHGLAELMEPGFIAEWMLAPNPGFHGLKPLEVIERGNIHWLWAMIFERRHGVAN